jgi:hypothetical protein
LRVLDHISDKVSFNKSSRPKRSDGKPIQEAVEYSEYGKDNYWTREKILKHTKEIVIAIIN